LLLIKLNIENPLQYFTAAQDLFIFFTKLGFGGVLQPSEDNILITLLGNKGY
jgi:hypothetical protein